MTAIRSLLKGHCRSALLNETSTDHRIHARMSAAGHHDRGTHSPPDALPPPLTAPHMLEE